MQREGGAMGDLWNLGQEGGAGWLTLGLSCAAKAAVVLAGVALVALGLRRRSAGTRHVIWCLGLAGALALPPLTIALPSWGLPVLGAESATGRGPAPEVIPADVATVEPVLPAPTPAIEARRTDPLPTTPPRTVPHVEPGAAKPRRPDIGVLVLAVWATGSLGVLAWCALGWASTRWLGCRAVRIDDAAWEELAAQAAGRIGLARPVTLLRGGLRAMPMTWGVLRPVVLLPAESDTWPAERRRTVLMHELAHVRRHDCLTQWLGLAACAAYWFNPLAWWAVARLRVERERACDDLVLESGERPSDYARQLLWLAKALRPAPARLSAALAMARPSGLETRLLAILDPGRRRRAPTPWRALAGLAFVLGLVAPLAAVRLVARADEPPKRAPAAVAEGFKDAVEGTLVGPDGRPVPGAVVALLTPDEKESDKSRLLAREKVDGEGRFRLAPENPWDRKRATVVAAAPGCGVGVWSLDKLPEPMRLEPERPTTVRIVDVQGAPVAGAEVELARLRPDATWAGLSAAWIEQSHPPGLVRSWTTDADGRLVLRGIAARHQAQLKIHAAGFGRQSHEVGIKAGDASALATVVLSPGHTVRGRVTFGDGGPPAVGARVTLTSFSEAEGYGRWMGEAETSTDTDGRYSAELSVGRSVRVMVYPPREGADTYLLRAATLIPGDKVASDVDFVLPKGVLVRGRIVEAGTSRPVVGAMVSHEAQSVNNPYYIENSAPWLNGGELKATTNADGHYKLAVMPGPGYLLVKGPTPDYLHEEISAVDLAGQLIWPNTREYPDALRKLAPKPDEGPLDVDLTLRRGVTVSGRVLDPDGNPVEQAVLLSRWYLPTDQFTINFGQRVLPVRDGRFELGGCDPDSSAPVLFLDAVRQLGAAIELSGRQAGEDVEITLQPCGSATVRFVDEQGKPLRAGLRPAHLEVVLTPGASFADLTPRAVNEDNQSPLMADAIMATNLDLDRYPKLRTDDEGRITFPTLIPGGTYRVIPFNQPVKTQIEFTVRPGETKDLGDMMIRNLDSAG
jgi:beta-lactamase regulating signal transducer with metallopeptidase domain